MTDLKAKIAAIFAEDDPFVGIGKSSYDKADRVLALIATPAAEPAPVAVQGAPAEMWCWQGDGTDGWDSGYSSMVQADRYAVRYIRADLATTGNTALVEAHRHENRARNKIINRCSTDLETIINGHDPEVYNLDNRVWDRLDKMAMEIEALSQPADTQPTPEVEALKARINKLEELVESAARIFANSHVSSGVCCCGDNMENHSHPMECGHSPVDAAAYASDGWIKCHAALARGSVAEKGDR